MRRVGIIFIALAAVCNSQTQRAPVTALLPSYTQTEANTFTTTIPAEIVYLQIWNSTTQTIQQWDGTQLSDLPAVVIPTLVLTDVTTNNSSTSQHGYLPKLSGNTSDVLKGNGTWGTISGGGDLLAANNLSDLANASTARTNLGLATTANQTDATNKRFITDAQQTVIGNTSGTNTGDNATNTQYSGLEASKLATNGNGSALTGLTKSQVGLANVDNTSDANKPVSAAMQTALDLKANSLGADDNYVTDAEKTKLSNLSNANSGDNATNTQYSGLAASKQDVITGLTSSGAELNILDGALLTTTELNTVDGVTSAIQGQIDGKQATLVSATNIKTINGTTVLGSGDLVVSSGYHFVGTLASDAITLASVVPVNLTGLVFNYAINSKYRIWAMGRVQPTAATTGCGFQFDLSSAVTAINVQFSHQLANTGTQSGGHSIADDASVGVSSGMPGTSTYPVIVEGLLVTGANTGTAQLRFRSETTAVTTCKAGFTLVIEKIQ